VGFVGAGVEKRFSPHCGVFAEARWQFDGASENIAVVNVGLSLVFGRGQNAPPQPLRTENVATRETPVRPRAVHRTESAANTRPTHPQTPAWNKVNLTGARAKVMTAAAQ